MNASRESRFLNNIVSPYGLAFFSYAVFLMGCLVPPSIYQRHMHEPDLMFLNPAVILFYTLCVAAFLAGVWFFQTQLMPGLGRPKPLRIRISTGTFLLLPLFVGITTSALSSMLLIRKNPTLLVMLAAQQGGQLRGLDGSGLEFDGTLRSAIFFLIGVIWWVYWRSHDLPASKFQRTLIRIGLGLSVLTVFISASLTISRQPFVVATAGLAILYLLRKVMDKKLTWRSVIKTVGVIAAAGAFFFVLVSWVRGASADGSQVDAFVGYTIASYNRMAAVVDGSLHYQSAGKGIYLSNFLVFNETLNRVVPVRKLMDAPDYFDWWASDFAAVGRAGLDASLIYSGMFGDIFVELGWFAPMYVLGYGLLYGFTWRSIHRGQLFGILLYPYFAHLITFWFGTNAVFETLTFALLADAILLAAYEDLFRDRSFQ